MSCFGKLFITMFNSIINKLFCSKLTHVLGNIKESNYPCNVHTLVTCTYTVSLNSVPFLKGDYSVQYYIQLSSRLLPPPPPTSTKWNRNFWLKDSRNAIHRFKTLGGRQIFYQIFRYDVLTINYYLKKEKSKYFILKIVIFCYMYTCMQNSS